MQTRTEDDTDIDSMREAWQLVAAVRHDMRVAHDVDEVFECRTGCLASARQTLKQLGRFTQAYEAMSQPQFASREELLLSAVVCELTMRAEPRRGG